MKLPHVILFILQKTTRSVARHLLDFLHTLELGADEPPICTAGAWSQARSKLSHRAFVELNEEVLLLSAYGDDAEGWQLKHWLTHRLIGFDGSLVRLPKSATNVAEFGLMEAANERGPTGVSHCMGRISVAYDLLNRLGWDARLEPVSTSEVAMAGAHLASLKGGDVVLMDRGYAGYGLLASLHQRGVLAVIRCSKGCFAAAQELFARDEAGVSLSVVLKRPWGSVRRSACADGPSCAPLPKRLTVRFVTVRLSTGELEVLVTTLLDETRYATQDFVWLYHQRWGMETYYLMLKSRLSLENWSGQSSEAVRQDLAATVLLFNMESLLTKEAQAKLEATPSKHKLQVNRANSYHALKTKLVDLLLSEQSVEQVLDEIQTWFLRSPVSQRPCRHTPRKPPATHRSLHFQRNVAKSVF